MQYPIIDLITSAYINNGWTGLNISTGKNKAIKTVQGFIASTTFRVDNDSESVVFDAEIGKVYTVSSSVQLTRSVVGKFASENIEDVNVTQVLTSYQSLGNDVHTWTSTWNGLTAWYIYSSKNTTVENTIQVEIGEQATDYEPYKQIVGISNNLKLPLPHYFPHQVIDALQRAAAGTQTADDTEILQHYLTPLGIGGI